jgi:LuxR family transcriptional regulator, maltose regulon positive regulatory protein
VLDLWVSGHHLQVGEIVGGMRDGGFDVTFGSWGSVSSPGTDARVGEGRAGEPIGLGCCAGEVRRPADPQRIREVIDTQPADIQDFLMVSGELDTFDASMCAAVGGWTNSAELLDRVRRANLFLVELAGSPGTFRYHHLFGQFLRGRLRAVAPHRVREIHAAAATAYQQRADPLRALRHRMLAGDTDAAFDDLRDYVISVQSLDDRALALASARALLQEFGIAQLERAPIKVLDCALALSVGGATDETATWLGRVEARESDLDASTQFQLHGVWSFYYMQRGDFSAALQRARRAQEMWRRSHIDNEWAYLLPNVLVQAHQWLGGLDAAEAELQALRTPTLPPVSTEVRAPGFGSYLQVLRGEFVRAQTLAIQALTGADQLRLPALNFGRAEPELALAVTAIEHNRLDDAQARLDRVMQIAEGGRRPPIEALTHVQQARLAAARGDYEAANESLREARRVFSDPKPPVLVHLDQVAARLALDRGDLASAGGFLTRLPSSPAADLLGARLHLATGHPVEAQSTLARVSVSDLVRTRVEHGLLSALALQESDRRAAYNALEAALLAAQRAGFLMTVVGEGPQLWLLLESLPASAAIADYVARLLETARGIVLPRRPVLSQRLTQPLSDRELTVLRHLSSRLDSTEIAAGLYVSVNTVRTHVKAIYRKLGVNSRIDAVSRGRALALL